jgi:TM2 domain-containing membrane protein YozV/type II secretory pathway pseudopilin PulG
MNKHCSSCGVELLAECSKCSSCGAIQDSFVYKSRIAAATLALFAGIFGGHRFYLGQWWGIFYLLFCWTYIPWLIAFIEGIVFLSTSQKSWNAKYNQGISAGSEKGTVVVIFACLFPAVAILGILAAIALPAYHDYTSRAKLAESHTSANIAMQAVEAYARENQRWPESIHDLEISNSIEVQFVDSIEIDDGVVYVNPSKSIGVSGAVIYVPSSSENGISWSCTESTVEPKYLPQKCRQ